MGKFVSWFATGVVTSACVFFSGCAVGKTSVAAATTASTVTPAAAPAISQVTPQSIPVGAPSQVIKVVGSNFGTQPVILWNGNALVTTTVDATTISGTVDHSVLTAPATIQLQVRNSADGQQSAAVPVTVASVAPTITTLGITTGSFPAATYGLAYSQTLQAAGGTPNYTWSVTSGSLPSGITLSQAGVLSGISTTPGTFTFTATVTDSGSPVQTASLTASITVSASTLAITTSSFPPASFGIAYSQTLHATGGTPGYTWSLTSGNLPQGLSLSSAGLISGIPTASGTFPIALTVMDSGNPAQGKSVTTSIAVSPSNLAITYSTLAAGSYGVNYSSSLQASGGTPNYMWSLISGGLPTGLFLAPSTGLIAGVPTAAGTFTFAVGVTDSGSPAQSKSITTSIVIAPSTLGIATGSAAGGITGAAYSQVLQATGGTPNYAWSITGGSLPNGLNLSPSGLISGVPNFAATFTFTATVTDSGSPAQSKSANYTIVVSPSSVLAITSSALASATSGASYSQALQAGGGTAPYSWSVTGGTIPNGLSLSSNGNVTGTPFITGTSNFTATVTDASSPAQTKSVATSIVVAPPALAVTTSSLPVVTRGTNYSQSLQAAGGTAPYTWSITSGSLPAGLTLTPSTGVISGTPTTSGTSSFTATIADAGTPAQTRSTNLSIVVSATTLSISSSALVAGTNGTGYSQTLQATGGTTPYAWSITSGSLAAGLTLTPSTGVISGTPTTSGTSNFTATVTDSGSPAQVKSVGLSITIAASSLSLSTSSLTAGTRGTAYSQTLQATGGTTPYNWSVTSGSLPAGLSLGSSTGVISGTPGASGTANFTVSISDASSPTQSRSVTLSLTIAATTLAISTSSLPSGTRGNVYSQTAQAAGGTTPYSWSVSSGSLPAGLSLASTTGVISGTPTASGTSSFSLLVSDASSPVQTRSANLSIVVSATTLAISSSAPAAGTNGTAYSQALQASGGTTPYTWSVTSGSLPSGLSLSSSTGVVSGTPTGSGASTFTVSVSDSSSPVQTKSATTSITIAPAALSITSSTLVSGVSGTAYAQQLNASGGTPSYTWNYTGNLPAGLTLAATTGVISGTPTTSGTFNFTLSVTDNSTPSQSRSATTSITIAPATVVTGPGTTWYIRSDGGSRYSSNSTNGQCDGKSDTAYGGVGINQHCAFNDYRYLWDDQSYGGFANWAISGGDTVIVRGGPWRVGFNQGVSPNDAWCIGGNGPFACGNPTIPAGSATQHTRILGENYASCNATNKTEIFGGYGVGVAVNLGGTQYVDVQCLNITRHSQCMVHGSPAFPGTCSKSYPLDDYDSDGVTVNASTHDLNMTDLWIHGHTDRGIIGPIGANVTCLRCDISYNGMAGWDFDDGSGPNSVFGANASLKLLYTTIEWSGCNQEYPAVDTYPAISCYSQSTGGYGDGIGTPAGTGTGMSVVIDHSIFRYNTQDGLDLGHMDAGSNTLSITNSQAYGNSGQGFKWGAYFQTTVFTNNLLVASCLRMSQPIPGAPASFNTNLTDFCRAQDALSFNFLQGGTALLANNTIVTYAPTTYDMNCWSASCSTSTLTFENNITLGYSNPTTLNMGGQVGGPGGFYFQQPIGNIIRNNNLYYGIRSISCPTSNPAEYCASPLFVNQPTWVDETSLDHFNFTLTPGSPAKGAGVSLPSISLDYNGTLRGNPPSIGAIE